MLFKELNLNPSILSALEAQGYETPTPVQAAAIPRILEGKDVLGCAQTGTGKTAAFALPILQLLSARPVQGPSNGPRPIRSLILTPTRELAVQIAESFAAYGAGSRLTTAVIFGGVGEGPQKAQLRRGVDILVATPGRLIDLMGQRALSLSNLEIFVLDEADRMLDMGFIHDVRRVCQAVPGKRQTLFFSATMPPEIRKLADTLLRNPVTVEVARVSSTAENIDQGVYMVPKDGKAGLLRRILSDGALSRVIVFTRTKHGADRVCRTLEAHGIPAEAIHGNKSQNNRQRALNGFKDGSVRVLVATDLASRGIDVDGVSHVINYDLPGDSESYVHRIGRTARAGASGVAISLCSPEERGDLKDIERLIKKSIPVLPTPDGADYNAAPAPRRASGNRFDREDEPGQAEIFATEGENSGAGGFDRPSFGRNTRGSDRGGHRKGGRPPAGSNRTGGAPNGSAPVIHHEGSRNAGPRQEGRPQGERPQVHHDGNRQGQGRGDGRGDNRGPRSANAPRGQGTAQGAPNGRGDGRGESRMANPGQGQGQGQRPGGHRKSKRSGGGGGDRSFVREYYSNR